MARLATRRSGALLLRIVITAVSFVDTCSTFVSVGPSLQVNVDTSRGLVFPLQPKVRTDSTLIRLRPDPNDGLDSILILPVATLSMCAAILVGALYAFSTNPNAGFDVDLYMALDGSLRDPPGSDTEAIVALPSLSSAETIVGAFFGPPHR